jgi:hypothetical protein
MSTRPSAVLPLNWTPSAACEPLDPDGAQKFWQVGPRHMTDAEINRATFIVSRWSGVPYSPPATYWVRAGVRNDEGFVLKGMGANLGVHPQV